MLQIHGFGMLCGADIAKTVGYLASNVEIN